MFDSIISEMQRSGLERWNQTIPVAGLDLVLDSLGLRRGEVTFDKLCDPPKNGVSRFIVQELEDKRDGGTGSIVYEVMGRE